MAHTRATPFAVDEVQAYGEMVTSSSVGGNDPQAASIVSRRNTRRAAIVVPAGLLADEELAKLSAHLSNSNTLTPRQRSMLKLSGTNKPVPHVHSPRTVPSCWELRTINPVHGRDPKGCRASARCNPLSGQACQADTVPASSMSSPWASKHCKPDKKTADMSGQQLEALWALSPEKLAIVQADPTVTPVATHSTRGQVGHTDTDETVDAWAGEITKKWSSLTAQKQKAGGAKSKALMDTPLQGVDTGTTVSQDNRPSSQELESSDPPAVVNISGRKLWGKLKTATAAHLAAQAKQKAKHDLEVADATAREERVAMQQYQNGEFIFRSSNAVKPATDLPEDMMKRVRAATQNFCTLESRPGKPAPVPAHTARPRGRRAGRDGLQSKDRHRYQTPWYVQAGMWGPEMQSKLKTKILARTGDTDPDWLKATGLDTLDWAQGPEQQAAQMYKKYIRQSGVRVPHYLRSVKTPDNNEELLLNSRVNWSSKDIRLSTTIKPTAFGIFANPNERLDGVYSVHHGNKDHMAVVAAAMQRTKSGEFCSRQASTRATIRGILSGIQ